MASSFLKPPVLSTQPHDVITLIALTGAGLIWDLRPGADGNARLLAMYTVSVMAGLTTMAFSTNPLLTSAPAPRSPQRSPSLATRRAWVRDRHRRRRLHRDRRRTDRLGHDVLWRQHRRSTKRGTDHARLLRGRQGRQRRHPAPGIVRDRVAPLMESQPRIAYIGKNPGVVLTTPAPADALVLSSGCPSVTPGRPKALAESANTTGRRRTGLPP